MNSSSQVEGTAQDQKASDLLKLYEISDEDIERVQAFGKSAIKSLDQIVGKWYEWAMSLPEFREFFPDDEIMRRVQGLQRDHWEASLRGVVNHEYVQRCQAVGETHARIGLPLRLYVAGVSTAQRIFADHLKTMKLAGGRSVETIVSLSKLLNLEMTIVVGTYTSIVNEKVTVQARALMEMSTPVTQIWTGILLLPVVGIIDSKRAQDIMNAALSKIADTQARMFILDISGVGVVDTAVANHLIKIHKASSLMGCECTISGVSPANAQTIVELGIDVGTVKTTGTMKDALANAFQQTGIQLHSTD